MSTSSARQGQQRLLVSNATDAASWSMSDLVIELMFVVVLGANAMDIGLLNALGSVAFLAASIPVGYLVDRYQPLRILRVGLSAKLVLLLALLLLVLADQLTIPLALFLASLLGVCNVFAEVAQGSAVPALTVDVGQQRAQTMTRLIARLSAADQSIVIIVPALTGIGFTLLGAPALLAMSVGLMLLALFFAALITVSKPRAAAVKNNRSRSGKKAPLNAFWPGLGFICSQPPLLGVTLLSAFANLGLAIGASVETIYIVNQLGLGATWFGVITAIGGAGGVLGALTVTRIAERFPTKRIIVISALAQALLAGLVLLSTFTSVTAALVLVLIQTFCWGIASIVFNVATTSWATAITPEQLIGRVISSRRMFTFGAISLGGIIGGFIGTAAGTRAAFLTWTLLILVGVASYALTARRAVPAGPLAETDIT